MGGVNNTYGGSGANDPYGSSGSNDPYGGSDPYGSSDPYGGSEPYGSSDPYGGGAPSPYGGSDQGPYTTPAQAAPSSGGGYADAYGGGQGYRAPGEYAPPGAYAGGGYPPVVDYQNAAGGWSLGLGIAAILLCIVPVLSQGIAIAAIITGAIGRKAVSEGRSNNGGMALAGIIIGAISLLISLGAVILWLSSIGQY